MKHVLKRGIIFPLNRKIVMKKNIAILSIVAFSVVGISCGNSKSSTAPTITEAKQTTTTTTYRTTTTAPSILDAYLATVGKKLPMATKAELIDLGEKACDTIDAYGSVKLAVIGIASDPSWTDSMAETAGYVIGAAIYAFCPEYVRELESIRK